MNKYKSDSLQKAKNYAFLLLKFRQRSAQEINQRLKQKNFTGPVIKKTVALLKEGGFIDDVAFTKSWIDSRLKKPLGIRGIKAELRLKGIANDIIDANIEEAKQDYSEEETVSRIAADKLSKIKGLQPQKAKRRIFSYLLRRGFSPQIISDTLAQL